MHSKRMFMDDLWMVYGCLWMFMDVYGCLTLQNSFRRAWLGRSLSPRWFQRLCTSRHPWSRSCWPAALRAPIAMTRGGMGAFLPASAAVPWLRGIYISCWVCWTIFLGSQEHRHSVKNVIGIKRHPSTLEVVNDKWLVKVIPKWCCIIERTCVYQVRLSHHHHHKSFYSPFWLVNPMN